MLYSYERLLLLSFMWVVKRQIVVRHRDGFTKGESYDWTAKTVVSCNCNKQCLGGPARAV